MHGRRSIIQDVIAAHAESAEDRNKASATTVEEILWEFSKKNYKNILTTTIAINHNCDRFTSQICQKQFNYWQMHTLLVHSLSIYMIDKQQ